MNEKLKALAEDQAFMEKIMECETPEDAAALFSAQGVDFTAKDLEIIKSRLESTRTGELSEDDLAAVAGGVDLDMIEDGLNAFVKVASGLWDRLSRRRW